MIEILEGQVSLFDQDTWYGKMFPVLSPAQEGSQKEKTSRPSSQRSQGSQNQNAPMFLYLKRGSGVNQDLSWEQEKTDAIFPSLGDYTMHSIGEFPKEENASRLSQILEAYPHPKYSLSAKACQGILNRAARRGKKLPPALEEALRRQATQSRSEGGVERDSAGKKAGKGALIQTELSGTLGVSKDQTLIVLNDQGGRRMGVSEDMACALRAEEHGHQPIVFEPGSASRCGDVVDDRSTVVYENHDQDARFKEMKDVCQSITARWGTGGNNQPLVVCIGNGQVHDAINPSVEVSNTLNCLADPMKIMVEEDEPYQSVVGKLDCDIAKGTNNQLVNQDMVVARKNTVRRLTPLECERLQGFPDGWTDIGDWIDSKGKIRKCTDGARYKALGNSIALPFWFYLLRRISAQYERPATMGSLFDGIGGFPLCWERCNGTGTAVWASEIEEFPIAVTKLRFPETDGG